MPSVKAPPPVYWVKITLVGIEPPIWRRIRVPSSIKLCCLHSAFQVVMGWTDSHLHQFEQDGKNWGVPERDEFDEFDLIDESKTQLAKVLKSEGPGFSDLYKKASSGESVGYRRASARRLGEGSHGSRRTARFDLIAQSRVRFA